MIISSGFCELFVWMARKKKKIESNEITRKKYIYKRVYEENHSGNEPQVDPKAHLIRAPAIYGDGNFFFFFILNTFLPYK